MFSFCCLTLSFLYFKGGTKHPAFCKTPVVMSKPARREKPQRKKKKKKIKTDPMFNVSFPLHQGAMLLERTSFRKVKVLEVTPSSLSEPDPVSSLPDSELKCVEASFENSDAERPSGLQTSHLKRHLCEEDADSGKYVPRTKITVTVFQDAEGSDGVHFNQSSKEREAEDFMVYGERNYRRGDGSQGLLKDWQSENVQAQRGGAFPAASHDEDWRPYKPYDRQEESNPNGWYGSAPVPTRVEDMRQMNGNNTTSCSAQHYHPPDQQMAWGVAAYGTGATWGHPNLPGDVAAFIEVARTNVQMHPMHGGSVSSEPGASFYETHPRQTGFNWYPQNYTAAPAALQVGHVNQMFNCQNTGPTAHPAWYGAEPVGEQLNRAWMQPNAFTQPGPAVYYTTGSFQNWGPD